MEDVEIKLIWCQPLGHRFSEKLTVNTVQQSPSWHRFTVIYYSSKYECKNSYSAHSCLALDMHCGQILFHVAHHFTAISKTGVYFRSIASVEANDRRSCDKRRCRVCTVLHFPRNTTLVWLLNSSCSTFTALIISVSGPNCFDYSFLELKVHITARSIKLGTNHLLTLQRLERQRCFLQEV